MDHGDASQAQPNVLPKMLCRLRELLALQERYQPNLTLPVKVGLIISFHVLNLLWLRRLNSRTCKVISVPFGQGDSNEVTLGIRDGSAHILRCLKVWYDLPTDALCISINIMDRFLTKMKVIMKNYQLSSPSAKTYCEF